MQYSVIINSALPTKAELGTKPNSKTKTDTKTEIKARSSSDTVIRYGVAGGINGMNSASSLQVRRLV